MDQLVALSVNGISLEIFFFYARKDHFLDHSTNIHLNVAYMLIVVFVVSMSICI